MYYLSIVGSFRWLRQLFVADHFVLDGYQNVLESVLVLPVLQNPYLAGIHLPVALVHTWQVHLRHEFDLWWFFGVVVAAFEFETDNSVVEASLHQYTATFCGPKIVPFQ